ncbi:MAG: VanZ family protein [Betaproteobacteria bacterium]
MNRIHFFRWAGTIVLIAIWALSLLPGPALPAVPGSDKWHHSLAYFACMFCWGQVFRRPLPRLRLAMAFVAMGILIECIQYFTPTRSFEFLDMAANAIGVTLAWFVVTVQISVGRRMSGAAPPSRPR